MSDEPYARLVFSDAEFHSPSEYYPYTLIAYSYGKVLLTPGERIGWLAISPSIPDRRGAAALRSSVSQIAAGWLFPNAVLQYAIGDLETLSIDLVDLERKRDRVADRVLQDRVGERPPAAICDTPDRRPQHLAVPGSTGEADALARGEQHLAVAVRDERVGWILTGAVELGVAVHQGGVRLVRNGARSAGRLARTRR